MLAAALKLLVAAAVVLGCLRLLRLQRCDRCEMPIMWPAYHDLPVPSGARYRAYYYGQLYDHFDTAVVYVHGNSGSYKQARTLGSWINKRLVGVQVVTLDFMEEFVAFSPELVRRQSRFLRRVVGGLRRRRKRVILVAHSMGVVVARRCPAADHLFAMAVPTGLLPLQAEMEALVSRSVKRETVVPTGWNDLMAPARRNMQLLPFCWSDPDHQATVWSHCVVRVLTRMIELHLQGAGTTIPTSVRSFPVDAAGETFSGPWTLTSLRYGHDFALATENVLRVVPGPSQPIRVISHASTYTPVYTIIEGPCAVVRAATAPLIDPVLYSQENAMAEWTAGDPVAGEEFVKSVTRTEVALRSALFALGSPVVFIFSGLPRDAVLDADGYFPPIEAGEAMILSVAPITVHCYNADGLTVHLSALDTLSRFVLHYRAELVYSTLLAGLLRSLSTRACILALVASPSAAGLLIFGIAHALSSVSGFAVPVMVLFYGTHIFAAVVNAKRRYDFTGAVSIELDKALLLQLLLLLLLRRRAKKTRRLSALLASAYALVHQGHFWALRNAAFLLLTVDFLVCE